MFVASLLVARRGRTPGKRNPASSIRINGSFNVTPDGDTHWRDASGTRRFGGNPRTTADIQLG